MSKKIVFTLAHGQDAQPFAELKVNLRKFAALRREFEALKIRVEVKDFKQSKLPFGGVVPGFLLVPDETGKGKGNGE